MAVSFHTEECTFLPQGRRRITAWIKEVITAEGYSPRRHRLYLLFTGVSHRNQQAVSRPRLPYGCHHVRLQRPERYAKYQRRHLYRPLHGTFQCGNHRDAAAGGDDAGHHTRRTAPLRPWRQNPGGGAGHACIGGPQPGRIPSGKRRLSSVRTAGPVRERPPKGKKYHRHGKGLFPPFQAHSIHRRTSTRRPVFPTGKALLRVQESVPPATLHLFRRKTHNKRAGERRNQRTPHGQLNANDAQFQRTDRPRQGQERR